MKTTLVVLVAEIGASYGVGIKQLGLVGPNGELIIDYSVHDAARTESGLMVLDAEPVFLEPIRH